MTYHCLRPPAASGSPGCGARATGGRLARLPRRRRRIRRGPSGHPAATAPGTAARPRRQVPGGFRRLGGPRSGGFPASMGSLSGSAIGSPIRLVDGVPVVVRPIQCSASTTAASCWTARSMTWMGLTNRDADHDGGQVENRASGGPRDLAQLGVALGEVVAGPGDHGLVSVAPLLGVSGGLAGAAGLEPTTAGFGDQCSTS